MQMKPWSYRSSHAKRRGVIVVLAAFLLALFLVVLTFSINVGYMQLVRTEMRAATDASAKAAAAALSRSETEAEARQAAINIAAQNSVAGQNLVLTAEQIEFGAAVEQADGTFTFDPGATILNSVRVNASRTSNSAQGAADLLMTGFLSRRVFEPVQTATATFADVDLCLVLDRSSSMKLATDSTAGFMSGSDPRKCDTPWADSRWMALNAAVNVFCDAVDQTTPIEHFGIVTYASNNTTCSVTTLEATVDLDLTGDTNAARSAMAARSSSVWNGNTNIAAGMALGEDVLTGTLARSHAKKIMIVLTDGNYTGGNPSGTAHSVANRGITIHTVTFSDGANQTAMQNVANIGGGHHFHAPDAASLNVIFRQLGARPASLIQ